MRESKIALLVLLGAFIASSECKWLFHYDTEKPCTGLKDGDYPVANVFEYLHCSKNNGQYKRCKEEYIFDPKSKKCVSGDTTNILKFCEYRENGNYQNPWNCNQFIQCVHNKVYIESCPKTLVYDSLHDICRDDLKCKQLSEAVSDDNPCAMLSDGDYPIRDVMSYLTCKNHQSTFQKCRTNQIFDAETKECVDAKSVTEKDFCKHRTDGDWSDPWNCNQFYKCFGGFTYKYKCQLSVLVYNPYNDQCVYPSQYDCSQIPKGDVKLKSNFCEGKQDGDYPIRDVFKYVTCKDGSETIQSCPRDYIYDVTENTCISVSFESIYYFCVNRTDGNWVNPWACHRYLYCSSGVTTNKPCPLDWLVYDPYSDTCVTKDKYECQQIGREVREAVLDDNPCAMLSDGDYPIRDVMSYLTCKNHQSTFQKCRTNQIFDAETKECVDAKSVTEKDFCKHRTDGDWSDPWNCNQFYKCFGGFTYKYKCQLSVLVYNPYNDQCVYPSQYNCVAIPKVTLGLDCNERPNGLYAIRDVFAYLKCQQQKENIVPCPVGYVFEDVIKSCVNNSISTPERICLDADNGNYRNPWDCNGYIACVGRKPVLMKCSAKGLVYDPYTDSCQYPSGTKEQCTQYLPPIFQPMVLAKPDDSLCRDEGRVVDKIFVTSSPFQYLNCTNGTSKLITCPGNHIFTSPQMKCLDVKKYDITPTTFCKNRLMIVGQSPCSTWYLDPWNCNYMITCVKEDKFVCIPAPPHSKMHFNPADQKFDTLTCTQLPNSEDGIRHSAILPPPKSIKDPCTVLPNGIYPIRNVLQFLECTDNVSKTVDCPANSIYVPGKSNCTDAGLVNEGNFCFGRDDGDWLNPWDCHSYYMCSDEEAQKIECNYFVTLNYDPVSDSCVYPKDAPCHELKPKFDIGEADDECKGKSDGQYAIPDVFHYLVCKGGKSSIKTCPQNQIYSSLEKQCVSITSVTLTTFCRGRKDGDWENPWNCNGYILCRGGVSQVRPCLINGFVFDPYKDVCVQSKDYPCYTVPVNTMVRSNHHFKTSVIGLPMIKDICTTLPDGNYSTRDVLQILQCKNKTSKWIPCPKDTIYLSGDKCTLSNKVNEDNFCDGRPEGDYMNPWDCHSYYVCHSGQRIHKQICNPFVTLNYDPVLDTCSFPTSTKCKQVGYLIKPGKVITSQCSGKADGNYLDGFDVFRYIKCKKGVSTLVKCGIAEIVSPDVNGCISITTTSVESFCNGRKDGEWRNPWNCNSRLVCLNGNGVIHPCLMNGFVFDPFNNICRLGFPCTQLTTASSKQAKKERGAIMKMPQIRDVCQMLPDGNYSTRDVFQMLECKNKKSKVHQCPNNTIYVSGNNCTDASKVTKDNFCDNRANGNYRNPWDCHSYFVCYHGHIHNQRCNYFVTLNYDPVFDLCESPLEIKCLQIPKKMMKTRELINARENLNPCAKLPDGKYNIRDVSQYLQCKNHVASYVKCSTGKIYNPKTKQCVSIKEVDPKNFCHGRESGNYRNPWNCHHYFTCYIEFAYDRPCSLLTTLNYDPWTDLCSYPYQYKCKNVTAPKLKHSSIEADDECKGKSDGQYAIPDVFHYLVCKGGKSSIKTCPQNQIYSSLEKQCVSITSVTLTTFCRGRKDGDWENPWNCNGYILCRGGVSQVRPCLINGFVFDPYKDVCVQSKDYPCYTVPVNTMVRSNHHFKTSVIGLPMIKDICTTLPDGNYSTRDILQILQCKNKTSKWIPCPKDTIYVGGNNCTNASKISEGNFCDGRPEGDYMNPWDCHSYYVCHSGQRIHKQICNPFVTLNYDPVLDTCSYPQYRECKQLKPSNQQVTVQVDDPCKGKRRGKYPIRDSFKYLKCSKGKALQVSCPDNTYYSALRKKCIRGKKPNIEYFCRSRPFGNYGNPWDCHSYITCHGVQTFNRRCSKVATLNYNPYFDRCENPKEYACKELNNEINDVREEEMMKQMEILI